jgi:poly-gamma-glutamate synthesis protein (capsule biosynthesis protein)
MNKKFITFIAVSFLWCLALGFFVYEQNKKTALSLQRTPLVADVILPTKKPEKPATILIFGDMMLDRKVREQINANGPEYPFALIKDFLKGNDIVVANAEGSFTNNTSVTLGRKDAPLNFTFDPTILPTLKGLGFTLLGQANNHTLNFGMAGFRQSTSSIEAAGLNWFGDPRNQEVKPYIAEIGGEKIAFIGYHEFAYQGLENVLQAIRDAKNIASFVVVCPHWGEEYVLNFSLSQQKVAHAFVDAGADVVIGAHPHVTQPVEMYEGKPIFYSLGNFIFDQASNAPTGRGLAVKISLAREFATYDLFPISISKQQASLMTPEGRQTELDRLGVQVGTIIAPR